LNFKIRPVKTDDRNDLRAFFIGVLVDTLLKEEIEFTQKMLDEEIEDKMTKFQQALDKNAVSEFFLAESDEQILGMVSVNKRGEFSQEQLPTISNDVLEIASLYVQPDYQHIGIGKRLLSHAVAFLKERGDEAYILDSGYKNAQKIWGHLLGEPIKVLPDFWEKGCDHMFWCVKIN